LLQVLESLSGQKLPKSAKSSQLKLRSFQLENVTKSLDFIKAAKVRLTCGADNIVDGR
jgi:hypothetical protein